MKNSLLYFCSFILLVNFSCSRKIIKTQETGVVTYVDELNQKFIEFGIYKNVIIAEPSECSNCVVGDIVKFIFQHNDICRLKIVGNEDNIKHPHVHKKSGPHIWGHIRPREVRKSLKYNMTDYVLVEVRKADETGNTNCKADLDADYESAWISESDFLALNLQTLSPTDEGRCAVTGFLRNHLGDYEKINEHYLLKEVLLYHTVHD